MKNASTNNQPSFLPQFVVSFILPLIILTRFSSESQLGPTKSLLVALALPVAFEIYNVKKRKKLSMFSVLAIGGILVTGAISLLGLSEEWLAVRRGVPYLAVSITILISMLFKRPIVNALLPQILDMETITDLTSKKHLLHSLGQKINRASYMLSGVFFIIALASYFLTRVVIVGQTGTADFNQEYARLRILSLALINLPLFVGVTGIILYLMQHIGKLTGLEHEHLLKKR